MSAMPVTDVNGSIIGEVSLNQAAKDVIASGMPIEVSAVLKGTELIGLVLVPKPVKEKR